MRFQKPKRLTFTILFLTALTRWNLTLAVAQTVTPDAAALVASCQQLMTPGAPVDTGPNAPVIRIAAPSAGEVVYGDQLAVTVETENFDINSNGQHWHLWVDGQLQVMMYGPTAIVNVAPGEHQVCAIMGNNDHADLGRPAGIIVNVEQPQPSTPTTTPPVLPEVAATYTATEEPLNPMMIVMMVGAAVVAAVGGWWLGRRLPKKGRP
jgi:hypothetical protein